MFIILYHGGNMHRLQVPLFMSTSHLHILDIKLSWLWTSPGHWCYGVWISCFLLILSPVITVMPCVWSCPLPGVLPCLDVLPLVNVFFMAFWWSSPIHVDLVLSLHCLSLFAIGCHFGYIWSGFFFTPVGLLCFPRVCWKWTVIT